MTKQEEDLAVLIGYHYGLGDIRYWDSPADYAKKKDIRCLAAKVMKFFKEKK